MENDQTKDTNLKVYFVNALLGVLNVNHGHGQFVLKKVGILNILTVDC